MLIRRQLLDHADPQSIYGFFFACSVIVEKFRVMLELFRFSSSDCVKNQPGPGQQARPIWPGPPWRECRTKISGSGSGEQVVHSNLHVSIFFKLYSIHNSNRKI
jgi:hypothetical protein